MLTTPKGTEDASDVDDVTGFHIVEHDSTLDKVTWKGWSSSFPDLADPAAIGPEFGTTDGTEEAEKKAQADLAEVQL